MKIFSVLTLAYTLFIVWFYYEPAPRPVSHWSYCHPEPLDEYQTSPYAFCDGQKLFWGDGSIVQQDL